MATAIVVGGSSGIGAAVVRRLARDGWSVVAVARRAAALDAVVDGLDGASAVVHDVTDTADVVRAWDAAEAALGVVDAIVYCAGVMPEVGPQEYNTDKDLGMVAVNLSGAIAWLNEAAGRFGARKAGTIVGIGSVAGDRGRVGNPVYCASKAGLHAYLEAIRNRLDRQGVRVVTIKPGPVRTPMTEGLDKLPLLIEADVAAGAIVAALGRAHGQVYVPWAWGPIMTAIRSVPSVIFRRLTI